jgi:hypothetical protein
MQLQAREARKIARLFLIATIFAIPTFVVGIVGMIALPKSHPFRQHIEKPVWGGAGLGVLVLWALATPVQFGVGWYVLCFETRSVRAITLVRTKDILQEVVCIPFRW